MVRGHTTLQSYETTSSIRFIATRRAVAGCNRWRACIPDLRYSSQLWIRVQQPVGRRGSPRLVIDGADAAGGSVADAVVGLFDQASAAAVTRRARGHLQARMGPTSPFGADLAASASECDASGRTRDGWARGGRGGHRPWPGLVDRGRRPAGSAGIDAPIAGHAGGSGRRVARGWRGAGPAGVRRAGRD